VSRDYAYVLIRIAGITDGAGEWKHSRRLSRRGISVRRNAIVLAVVSLIVGAFMVSMLPVQAHHSDRAIKRRLANLEYMMSTCLYYIPVSRFDDYRAANGTQVTALDVHDDQTIAPQYLMLAIQNNSECITARRMISGAAKMPKATNR
jgi:hypothetical protein